MGMRLQIGGIIGLLFLGLLGLQRCPTQPSKSHDNEPDTTSNAFTWTIDTLGNPQYGSSSLSDVAIVDEDDIWAVGNIATDSGEYNAARWDGERWQMIRIAPAGYFGPITAVYAFSSNDIWFGKYGLAFHYNGTVITRYEPSNSSFPGMPSINAIWGTSSSNLYFVGNSGTIVYYDGATFTREGSGIQDDIGAITGVPGSLLFAVYSNFTTANSGVLQAQDGAWHVLFNEATVNNWPPTDFTQPSGSYSEVFVAGDTAYIGCASLYAWNWQTGQGRLVPLETMHWRLGWGTQLVNGTGSNDLWVVKSVPSGLQVVHYNGQTWQSYPTLQFHDGHRTVPTGMAVSKQQVVIAGDHWDANHAVVIRGKRND